MRWLGLLVCGVAAYLLAGSPLAKAAMLVAVLNLLIMLGGATLARSRTSIRALTALGHLTTALGGFFLFVWLAAR